MAEINLTGIDRSNSNENGIPEAASLIINARKKGSTWEYVGDKIGAGINKGGVMYPYGYFWHYKIKGWYSTDDTPVFTKAEMIIAINEFEFNNVKYDRTIDVLTLNGLRAGAFLDSNGFNEFAFSADEKYLSLHSLNDIIILDTDKNKYYFVWDEQKYTFVQLPELDDFEISVSSEEVDFDIENIYSTLKISNFGEVNIIKDIVGLKKISSEMIRSAVNNLKSKIIDSNLLWKGFRIVAAVELIDGNIIKVSNTVDFIDNFFSTKNVSSQYRGTAKNYQQFTYRFKHIESLYYLHLRCFGVRNDYNWFADINDKSNQKIVVYKNVKVNLISNFYTIFDKWINADLVKNFSIYITEPKDFLEENKIAISMRDELWYDVNGAVAKPFENLEYETYTPYDNKEAYRTDISYYKIGELDIQNKKTSFEIEAKFLKDVVSKKPLEVKQDLSKKYVSKVNTIYNGMIHKCDVQNIIKIKDLIKGYNQNVNGIFYVDFKIKEKWYRYKLKSSLFQSYFIIDKPRIEFSTLEIKEANLILEVSNGVFKIFKKLELRKSPYTNSIIIYPIIDFNTDPTLPTTYDIRLEHNVIILDKYWYEYYSSSGSGGRTFTVSDPIEFKEFNFYNCDVRFLNVPQLINKLPSPTYTIEPNLDTIYYEDTNRLQLSATEDPFIYPSERSYRFGESNNKVIACDAAVAGTSDTKFGMLPLYVFTKQGLWVMETGQGDMAYISQHLLENINCYDNHKLIHRVLGGVVFGADNGIYVISGTTLTKLTDKLEGRVVLNDVDGIQRRIADPNAQPPFAQPLIGDPDYCFIYGNKRIDNIMQEYFTNKSFCVYDKIENELLFIEPTKYFTLVLQLNNMTWTTRVDLQFRENTNFGGSGALTPNFDDCFEMNGNYILVKNYQLFPLTPKRIFHNFYKLEETTTSKSSSNVTNNAVVFASCVIMMNQYMKIEHIISRFKQITDTDFDSHIFILGSRDGIEWKVLNHSFAKFTKNMSGQEMRRCFTSARYFQFVYIRLERGKQNKAQRKDSYFERFTFDMSNSDAEGKLR